MFHVLFFFILILVFSGSFVSFSQQDLSIVEIIVIAERDARRDANGMAWFGGGFLLTGGSLLALRVLIPPASSEAPTLTGTACILHGIALASAFMAESAPPPTRLVGKSAEYVDFYTDAYKAETSKTRALWGIAGSVSGCLVVSGCLIMESAD